MCVCVQCECVRLLIRVQIVFDDGKTFDFNGCRPESISLYITTMANICGVTVFLCDCGCARMKQL